MNNYKLSKNTKNKSFYRMWMILSEDYFLRTYDPDLVDFDLEEYNELRKTSGISEIEQTRELEKLTKKIIEECKQNIWFFFREILRIPYPSQKGEYDRYGYADRLPNYYIEVTKYYNEIPGSMFMLDYFSAQMIAAYENKLNALFIPPNTSSYKFTMIGLMLYESIIKNYNGGPAYDFPNWYVLNSDNDLLDSLADTFFKTKLYGMETIGPVADIIGSPVFTLIDKIDTKNMTEDSDKKQYIRLLQYQINTLNNVIALDLDKSFPVLDKERFDLSEYADMYEMLLYQSFKYIPLVIDDSFINHEVLDDYVSRNTSAYLGKFIVVDGRKLTDDKQHLF